MCCYYMRCLGHELLHVLSVVVACLMLLCVLNMLFCIVSFDRVLPALQAQEVLWVPVEVMYVSPVLQCIIILYLFNASIEVLETSLSNIFMLFYNV